MPERGSRAWTPSDDHQTTFRRMWDSLVPIGRAAGTGGYRRYAWTPADLACRQWFRDAADTRGLAVEQDRNGNLWAWWDVAGRNGAHEMNTPVDRRAAVVTGSHLDSVPDGGAYDGPLGVVSAFAAIDLMCERGVTPNRPLAVVAFSDEEGARFGVACVGSRLMTGSLVADKARALRDAEGVTLAEAMEQAGADPGAIGRDDEALSRIDTFVELHVEQGRGLVGLNAPVGVATSIWPHGRWRFDFAGEGNHAGTTRFADRRDPMLTFAETVLSARKEARLAGALATFGKVRVEPNGTNAIPSAVTGWLDARAPEEAVLDEVVAAITRAAAERGGRDGVTVGVDAESVSPVADFDKDLRDRIAARLGGAPLLPTGAGHDAGVLAAEVATAMLFVRNPTGVSHSPAEFAEEADCLAGVAALSTVLTDLACPA